MRNFHQTICRFAHSEEGHSATEYAVLIAVISAGVLVAMGSFGTRMNAIYLVIAGTMPDS